MEIKQTKVHLRGLFAIFHGFSRHAESIVGPTIALVLVLILSACQQGPGTAGAATPVDVQPSFGAGTIDTIAFDTSREYTWELPRASGGDGTLTYSLTPGIAGMQFDATLRRLSGRPTTAGEYAMTYGVKDADGDTASLMFTVIVVSMEGGGSLAGVLQGDTGGTIVAAGANAVATNFDRATVEAALAADLSRPISELLLTAPAVGAVMLALAPVLDTYFRPVEVRLEVDAGTSLRPVSDTNTVELGLVAVAMAALHAATPRGQDSECNFGTHATLGNEILDALERAQMGQDTEMLQRIGRCLATFREDSPALAAYTTAIQQALVAGDQEYSQRILAAAGSTRLYLMWVDLAEELAMLFTAEPGEPATDPPHFDELSVASFLQEVAQARLEVGRILELVLPAAADGDGELTYALAPDIPGLTFDPDTRTLSGTPTVPNTYHMTYTATDANGRADELMFSIIVNAPPDKVPMLATTVGSQAYIQHESITPLVLPYATGGDEPLAYRLFPDIPGLEFDPNTRTLNGTPTAANTYRMTYTVTDADGDADRLNFSVTVRANQIPRFDTDVESQTYTNRRIISPLVLPEAIGGDGPLTYTLDDGDSWYKYSYDSYVLRSAGVIFDWRTRTMSDSSSKYDCPFNREVCEVGLAPGTISNMGIAGVPGTYDVTYTATDADGDEAELVFQITVLDECTGIADPDCSEAVDYRPDRRYNYAIREEPGWDYHEFLLTVEGINTPVFLYFTRTTSTGHLVQEPGQAFFLQGSRNVTPVTSFEGLGPHLVTGKPGQSVLVTNDAVVKVKLNHIQPCWHYPREDKYDHTYVSIIPFHSAFPLDRFARWEGWSYLRAQSCFEPPDARGPLAPPR